MTRATITIKRKNGKYDQLWYVNSDGYPDWLGKAIMKNLKSVDDVERAHIIFRNARARCVLETNYVLGEVASINPILEQNNDYSYVLDEETGKWGYYDDNPEELYDLEEVLRSIDGDT